MDGGSPGVLESGAGAEPLLQALDAPGVKPGAGQCFHSWGNYFHTNGRMLHIHGWHGGALLGLECSFQREGLKNSRKHHVNELKAGENALQ